LGWVISLLRTEPVVASLLYSMGAMSGGQCAPLLEQAHAVALLALQSLGSTAVQWRAVSRACSALAHAGLAGGVFRTAQAGRRRPTYPVSIKRALNAVLGWTARPMPGRPEPARGGVWPCKPGAQALIL